MIVAQRQGESDRLLRLRYCFFGVFFFFLTDPPACAAVLVVTVGPDFDGSTVAGGIDLISQTAASWGGGGQKGRGCLFYRAVLCSAACNYPPFHTRSANTK